jgi:carboxypeptidase Taq
MSFQKLDELGRKLEALEHALAILGADEATHMAVGGGEKRAEAMASLAGMLHRQSTAPEIADWIDAAAREDLNDDQRIAVAEFRRHYTNLTCLPSEFVERQTKPGCAANSSGATCAPRMTGRISNRRWKVS